MADEIDLSAVESAASQSSDSAVTSTASDTSASVSSSPSQASTGVATSSAGAASAQQTQSGQAQAAWNLRQELSGLGIDASQYADDQAAWKAFKGQLAEQVRQQQQLAQWGQHYLAQKQQYDAALAAYQKQQQAAAQPQQGGEKEPWWKVPEWNEQYERLLTRDKNGNVVAIPGADPSLPLKYQAYQQWQAETFKNFLTNPIETLRPGLEELIQAKANELIEKRLGGYSDNEQAHRYVANAPWMFQQDANGQRVLGPNGRPQLSPAGQRFAQYVQYAEKTLGIRDVQRQAQFAQNEVQREYLLAHYQRQQQASQQAAAQAQQANDANAQLKNDAVNRGQGRGARRLPNSGALGTQAAQKVQPAGQTDHTLALEDKLFKAFQDNGIRAVA